MLIGAILRVLMFPPPYVLPSVDELGYVSDGLLLLEGATPGYKFAPAAITTWPAFLYGFSTWILQSVNHAVSDSGTSLLVRPLLALDSTLFSLYADMSGVRVAVQLVSVILSMLGVVAAWMLGNRHAGWPGGLLSGGLMATVPLIVIQSVMSKPYAGAWSLAVMAVASATLLNGRSRWILSGFCLGLSVASRIEMILIVPAVLWACTTRSDHDRKTSIPAILGLAGVTFLVAAPWYVTHLIGNVRKIVTVKLISLESVGSYTITEGLRVNGLELAIVVLVVGLLLRLRDDRWSAISALALFLLAALNALRGTEGGLRHQGDLLVYIVAFSGFALAGLERLPIGSRRRNALMGGVAVLVLIPPAIQAFGVASTTRRGWVPNEPVAWIEEHVPEGTPLYFNGGLIASPTKVPLPTPSAADRNWEEFAEPDAWRRNFDLRLAQSGLELVGVPRALSMEHMYQKLGSRRRYYILGGRWQPDRPRYELRLGATKPIDAPETQELLRDFERTGGVLLHYGEPVERLGRPARSWIADNGTGVFIYRQ